jgi:small subunit ribosomal protein S3
VLEDLQVRGRIADNYPDAGISRVEIERSNNDLTVTIHTARPGIVIGRGGQRVEELRKDLERIIRRRARLNVQEIRQPELDAFLVARNVADQLERRIAFRRAIRQTLGRTMQAGAKGIKILCSGRLGGADIARSEKAMEGRVPLHTLRADIDYGLAEAATDFGRIGVKVWIYKGDILPETVPEPEIEEEISPIEVTLSATPDPIPGPATQPQAVQTAPAAQPQVAPMQPPVAPAPQTQPPTQTQPPVAPAPTPEVQSNAPTEQG